MRPGYDAHASEVFGLALPEAQRWCLSRVLGNQPLDLRLDEPDPTLRSMLLCPDVFAVQPHMTVWSVVERRFSALGRPAPADVKSLHLAGGRILFYDPGMSLADGAACAESKGFFDLDNVPPWDTWLCFADNRFVVTWVPPALLERAEAGIDVNPERCIEWASRVDTPFAEFLRSQGLAD